jgi:hypothetical protein
MNYLQKFEKDGYIIIENFLNSTHFDNICNSLNKDLNIYCSENNLNKLGGSIIGNLNVFPGKYASLIYEELCKNCFLDIVEEISQKKKNELDILVGGNLALPNKHNQHFHTDGKFKDEMIMCSIATEDVLNQNGPTEIVLDSHRQDTTYWKFLLSKKEKRKLIIKKGDLLIRKHSIWHRGTQNKSNKPRFVIAFLIFDKKRKMISNLKSKEDLRVYNNFFGNNFYERVKEFLYVYFKIIFIIYKIILSLKK